MTSAARYCPSARRPYSGCAVEGCERTWPRGGFIAYRNRCRLAATVVLNEQRESCSSSGATPRRPHVVPSDRIRRDARDDRRRGAARIARGSRDHGRVLRLLDADSTSAISMGTS